MNTNVIEKFNGKINNVKIDNSNIITEYELLQELQEKLIC